MLLVHGSHCQSQDSRKHTTFHWHQVDIMLWFTFFWRRRIWGQPLSEHFFQYIPPGETEREGDKTKVHFTHWSNFDSLSKNLLNQGNILVDHFMSTLLGNLFYLLWRSYSLCDKYVLKFRLSCLEYNKFYRMLQSWSKFLQN